MIYLLAAYVLSVIIILFVSTNRFMIAAVSTAFLMVGLIQIGTEGVQSWSSRIQVVDMLFFRAAVMPVFFIKLLRKDALPSRKLSLPAKSTLLALALILCSGSYWFTNRVFSSITLESAYFAVALIGILTGILILALNSSIVGQISGFLTMESGIALAETLRAGHEHWIISSAVSIAFAWSVLVLLSVVRNFLECDTNKKTDEQEVL